MYSRLDIFSLSFPHFFIEYEPTLNNQFWKMISYVSQDYDITASRSVKRLPSTRALVRFAGIIISKCLNTQGDGDDDDGDGDKTQWL